MDKQATTIWNKACRHLKETLSKDVYERWIAVIHPVSLEDHKLKLSVANGFYQSWLEDNYLPLIRHAVSSVAEEPVQIIFGVDRQAAEVLTGSERTMEQPAQTKPKREQARPRLNERYVFESFVVGPSNSFAHAASLAVAQSPARAYNPLFIYGGSGLGKTHLMQAIGNHVLETNPSSKVCFISCEAFTNEYIDAIQKKGLVQFRRKYRNCDLLLIDDIHFLSGKERMQEEFFHTFNSLFDNHKQIVLTCDRPASEIPGLEHRLVSRFEWGLVVELETPEIETRIAIIRKKAEQLNLDLPSEVLVYLAERIRSNIRRLEGALIRVASYKSLTGKELTSETLEYLLRDTLDQEKSEAPTIEGIQRLVADYFDLRLADMTSKRRPQNIAFPRQVAMYLCRTHTQHSLPSIGNAFGRNHATVIHACKLIEEKMSSDASFRQTVSVLNQKLVRG